MTGPTRRELLGSLVLLLPAEGAAVTDPRPRGPTGRWHLAWEDTFLGDAIDPGKWTLPKWHVQNVDMNADPEHPNAWVYGGNLVLDLSSTGGGMVRSTFGLMPGMFAEWRARFAGSDADEPIWNWPALWTAGFAYPRDGEIDVAEGVKGTLKVSYWDRDKAGPLCPYRPPGDWNNDWHTFGLSRGLTSASVWYDGRRVWRCSTNDGGGPQAVIASLGSTPGVPVHIGQSSRMRVDYVRVWRR